jgi:hypothetical protein
MMRYVTVTGTDVKRIVSEYRTTRSPDERSDIRVCGAALHAAPGIAPLTRLRSLKSIAPRQRDNANRMPKIVPQSSFRKIQ